MSTKAALTITLLALVAICRTGAASGILIPEDEELPPLAIKTHRVSAVIDGHVATTRAEQVFLNSTNRRLEATYVFPVPRDAAIGDFALYMNGKRQSGEVLEAGKARKVYEDIVRRMRDPGLLEYMDDGLLRMRVFPIEAKSTVQVEVSYVHALRFESGVYEYAFPLKTGSRASSVLEDFTLAVDISSGHPIKNVYCPTHEVGVTRKDDYHALAGFEKTGFTLDSDLSIFYTVGEEDFGLNLLTHRTQGSDGFFALMISPRTEIPESKVMPKDVCFVLDTSGSMQDENRIQSARDAVKFCLNALNRRDRFALITFSTGVEVYGDGLSRATAGAVSNALNHVSRLEARGGTALCAAALEALRLTTDRDRPYLVVLVTDGKPTVGVTEPEEIIQQVEQSNKRNVRVFTFGIAENLNVPLLDRIAATTRGYSEYMMPGSEIEARISTFFRKVSSPVLSDLKLGFGDVSVRDMYPQELPDLFRGSQLVVFGRYGEPGDAAVRLTGRVEGDEKEFIYDATFADERAGHGFLPQLWARRKIGFLLDEIRLHGESEELVTEITRLSREYGIATPYTSYLVLEDEDAYKRHGIMREEATDRLASLGMVTRRGRASTGSIQRAARYDREAQMLGADMNAPSAEGAEAVSLSMKLRDWKQSVAVAGESEATALRRVGAKKFLLLDGAHIDCAFEADMKAVRIKWGSDAYFNTVDALPELVKYLALGREVVVVLNGRALVVAGEGDEIRSVREIKQFFRP
jgi:Ca-activated chloride channel family protein